MRVVWGPAILDKEITLNGHTLPKGISIRVIETRERTKLFVVEDNPEIDPKQTFCADQNQIKSPTA